MSSARFTTNDLHPVIFSRIKAVASYAWGMGGDGEKMTAVGDHSSVWFKEYWLSTAVMSVLLVGSIFAAKFIRELTGSRPITGVFMVVALVLWMVLLFYLINKNHQIATLEELEALRPALDLPEVEGLYLDSFIALQKSPLLDQGQKAEWSKALADSLSQALALDHLKNQVLGATGSGIGETESEVQRLKERIASATDPVARKVYEDSLEIAESRLARIEDMRGQLERIEAHSELVRQSFLQTIQSVRHMEGTKTVVAPDLSPLRQNLLRVHQEAQLVRDAFAELDASLKS